VKLDYTRLEDKKNIRLRMLMFFFLILSLIFFHIFSCQAKEIYIAKTASGNHDATSCIHAKAINDLSYSDGLVIHLCGTITSVLTIDANHVTVIFEKDAKISAPAWKTGTAAITCSGKNGLIIDGGINGIIEATDNGSPATTTPPGKKAHQNHLYGVSLTQCDNAEVKNLSIRNLYERVANSDDKNRHGRGIHLESSDHVLIHDNSIQQAYYGIVYMASNHDTIGGSLYNNVISKVSTGIVSAIGTKCRISGITSIYNNIITEQFYWDGCWDNCSAWHHNDGVHIWGDGFESIKIYNNTIGGNFGKHMTSPIFMEGYANTYLVYNNVIYSMSGKPTNGYITTAQRNAGTIGIYNNTIHGVGTHPGGGVGIYIAGKAASIVSIKNNIINNVYTGIWTKNTSANFTIDYNNYNALGSIGWTTCSKSWAQWQTLGYETHGLIRDPLLLENYAIPTNSPAKDAGTDLSKELSCKNGITCVDKTGNIRPYNIQWDIGAYEYTMIGKKP